MKYVLLNRENVVVDILDGYIRYIKLQSSNGITIACEENEGTGVIGSDSDTHYVLMKADMTSNPNAVRVMEFEEIPSDIRPNLAYLDTETGELVCDLDNAKHMKQEENKTLFAKYLVSHPLIWVDGKEYGVTEEDQSEISLNINQYQIALQSGVDTPTLEWHARHEECTPWTLEQLIALSMSISQTVYPVYHKMQQFKTAIFGCTTIDELEAIELQYEDKQDEEVSGE